MCGERLKLRRSVRDLAEPTDGDAGLAGDGGEVRIHLRLRRRLDRLDLEPLGLGLTLLDGVLLLHGFVGRGIGRVDGGLRLGEERCLVLEGLGVGLQLLTSRGQLRLEPLASLRGLLELGLEIGMRRRDASVLFHQPHTLSNRQSEALFGCHECVRRQRVLLSEARDDGLRGFVHRSVDHRSLLAGEDDPRHLLLQTRQIRLLQAGLGVPDEGQLAFLPVYALLLDACEQQAELGEDVGLQGFDVGPKTRLVRTRGDVAERWNFEQLSLDRQAAQHDPDRNLGIEVQRREQPCSDLRRQAIEGHAVGQGRHRETPPRGIANEAAVDRSGLVEELGVERWHSRAFVIHRDLVAIAAARRSPDVPGEHRRFGTQGFERQVRRVCGTRNLALDLELPAPRGSCRDIERPADPLGDLPVRRPANAAITLSLVHLERVHSNHRRPTLWPTRSR